MDILLFLPETFLLILAVLLLCLTPAKKGPSSVRLNAWVILSAGALLGLSFYSLRFSGDLFYSTYRVDLLSQGFKFLLAMAFFFTALLSADSVAVPERSQVEYYFFLSTATLGMMLLTSAADLLTLYVALELSSYSLYLLTALQGGKRNAEAGVKYLLFGAATSGVLLWGLSLISGLAGTTTMAGIAARAPDLLGQPAFFLGLVFVLLAFLFKLSGFPAHFWAPDIYEATSTPVTHFIATASKGAAVAILIRFLMLMDLTNAAVTLLGIFAFVSMTLGNCVALVQRDLKRLLAYSSIAQAGYILVGLLAGSFEGYSSVFFYAAAYILMNTGVFLVIVWVAKSIHHDNPQIEHLNGLADRSPFLALILLLSLLSLAGIPPLVGFTGKWILFSAAMNQGHWFLVLWGVSNSVVSLFYYLTLVRHAYLEKPPVPAAPLVLPWRVKALGLSLFCALVLLGIAPDALITFAQKAVALGLISS